MSLGKKPKIGMKQIHVKIPEDYLYQMEVSIRKGEYSSISEGVRIALRDFFKKYDIFDLDKMNKKYKRR